MHIKFGRNEMLKRVYRSIFALITGGPTILHDINCESQLKVKFFGKPNLTFPCFTNSTMEQRVKFVEAFYENGRSYQNAFRALRDYFGRHNRPNVSTNRENCAPFSVNRVCTKYENTWLFAQFILLKTLLLFAIVWLGARCPSGSH